MNTIAYKGWKLTLEPDTGNSVWHGSGHKSTRKLAHIAAGDRNLVVSNLKEQVDHLESSEAT